MKNNPQKQVATSATVVAFIILSCSLLPLLIGHSVYAPLHAVRMPLFLLFPHEVLSPLKYLLSYLTRSYLLADIPLFSILLAIFLFIAIAQLRNKQKKGPLLIACCILLLSILISIPGTIAGYRQAVKAYYSYVPSTNTGTGILGLLDDFAVPHKPSLPLLIAQLVILLLYMGWAVWVPVRLYAKDNAKSPLLKAVE